MSFSDFIRTHCCSTMELKAKALLLLVCVTIIILTSTEVDAIACCLTVSKKIPKRMLVSVSKYQIQEKSGICDIDAVILFVKKKLLCADPEVLNRMKKLKKKNRKPKRTQTKAE